MFTYTRYNSQIGGVNTSSTPTATMVKTAFDAGTSKLTGFIYGDTLNELDTPVDGQSDLVAFKVAALAAINAQFIESYADRATLSVLDFTIAVDGLNVVASTLYCNILYNADEEGKTQFQNVFGLVFDTNKYVLADALGGTNIINIMPPATTLLAQQGRQPLQIG